MVMIRLRKPGKSIKRRYHYKIVVMDKRSSRDSKFIDQVGYYDPSKEVLNFDVERYSSWRDKGAQPSDTVASLFKRFKKSAAKAA